MKMYVTNEKFVSAIPAGLKCETRNSGFACSTVLRFVGFLYLMLSLISILLIKLLY